MITGASEDKRNIERAFGKRGEREGDGKAESYMGGYNVFAGGEKRRSLLIFTTVIN